MSPIITNEAARITWPLVNSHSKLNRLVEEVGVLCVGHGWEMSISAQELNAITQVFKVIVYSVDFYCPQK